MFVLSFKRTKANYDENPKFALDFFCWLAFRRFEENAQCVHRLTPYSTHTITRHTTLIAAPKAKLFFPQKLSLFFLMTVIQINKLRTKKKMNHIFFCVLKVTTKSELHTHTHTKNYQPI